MSHAQYAVITPVRNEGDHFAETIAAIVGQTVRPMMWVIVDDGSSDATGPLADGAARDHSWIRVVHRTDRGFRQQGTGVIAAFYDGFELCRKLPWDFLVKLDGDLSFEKNYFESCLARFSKDPKLGIGGGTICRREAGGLVTEVRGDPKFHVRGATKIYRRACWDQIGGLLKAPGWDTIDELKANMLGWVTQTFDDLKLHQHKDTGSADGAWRNWVKNGLANYITAYHPLFMMAKCSKRSFSRPYLLGAAGLACGFLSGYFRQVPRIEDSALKSYIRHQQWRKLTFRSSLWD
ncbi:MAG: glycosyltransferase family 2 protein [Verrucomicrobiota bacterium]